MSIAVSALVTAGLVGASIAGTAAVASADPAVLEPKITGSTSLGATLTADIGDFSGDIKPYPYGYEWVNVTENPSTVIGRSSTFSPEASDRGDELRVKVIPVSGAPVTTSTVIVSAGSLATGQSSVEPENSFLVTGTFFAPLTTYSLVSEPFATTVTTDADGRFSLSVPVAKKETAGTKRVTVTHQTAGSVTSANIIVTQPPKPPVIKGTSPTISGTVKVGNTIRASVGSWTKGVTFDYQWLRSGKVIDGAINSTYTIPAADVGKTIRVRLLGRSDDASITVTSAASTVKSAAFSSTPSLRITGKAKVKRKLKAVTSGGFSPAAAVTLQWYVNGVKITGATSKVITVKKSWRNKVLSVKLVGKQLGYTTVSKTVYSARIKK